MTNFPDTFVTELATLKFDHVFNPYSDRCPDHDRPDAPGIRRRNLVTILAAAESIGTDSIWFGRDLGYRGGRRTGLALTDELHLAALGQAFGNAKMERATITEPVAERTAREIWRMIKCVPVAPLLWNAFPLHPFEPGNPMTNRCHTAREARMVEDLLESLLAWLRPARIIALGNDAHRALVRMGHDAICIRHPSYGGQAAFVAGISEVYGLKCAEEPMLPL
jgi:uracil-DNA glycosylase